MSRRQFLGTTTAAAAFTIVPRRVLGGPGHVPPSDKINFAIIGVGGQGIHDMKNFMELPEVQVVSVCDVVKEIDYSKNGSGDMRGREPAKQKVNDFYTQQTGNTYQGCTAYVDFYEMLEKEAGIDAISVATPDNTHAIAAMAGIKMKKHVYCQKPLTHDIWEARQLTLAAREHKVMTQMGNQGHAGEGNRFMVEWIADGAIGEVHEVHCWTNRPAGYWPQGVTRPDYVPAVVPETIDWNRWVGPAPFRPYHPAYLPFVWRGWWDFGTGALGDMGCHIMDTAVWALNLGHPTAVQASASPFNEDSGPIAAIVYYEFPARGKMPPVKLVWYEGGLMPPRPLELEEGRRMGDGCGVLFLGTKGAIMCNTYGEQPRIIPETKMQAYMKTQPSKKIKRITGGLSGIYADFINAIKTGEPACSNFDISGPLTEIVLMGNLAVHMKGQRLLWDGEKMEVTNVPEANKYVKRQYREGWSL
jgi:predicted dehydrogenase